MNWLAVGVHEEVDVLHNVAIYIRRERTQSASLSILLPGRTFLAQDFALFIRC